MRRLFCAILLLVLLPVLALAEAQLSLDRTLLSVGETVTATASGGTTYRYTLFKDGEQIAGGEKDVSESVTAYRAREAGDYTLRVTVTDADGNEGTAERNFRVTGASGLSFSCGRETASAGDVLIFTAGESAVDGCTYEYAVQMGNECIEKKMSTSNTFQYMPSRAGQLTVRVVMTDERGKSAESETKVQITEGSSIAVLGDRSALYAGGGIRALTVYAPSIWTAETENDFITLLDSCGESGDALTFFVSAMNGTGKRTGKIIIKAGNAKTEITVTQRGETDEDEEVYLYSEDKGQLYVNGALNCTWQEAEGERLFYVAASDVWTATTDADFLTLRKSEEGLYVTAEENALSEPRTGLVTIKSGSKQALLQVFQPEADANADVLSVSLDKTSGLAFADSLTAVVQTEADAETLTIACDAREQALVYERDDAAEMQDDVLVWTVQLPLCGSGTQNLLFAAENESGMGEKQCASIHVTGEIAGFSGDAARLTAQADGSGTLTVTVTAATEEMTALDKDGRVVAEFLAADAFIDRCVDSEGRFAEWTIALTAEQETPAELRIGDSLVPVKKGTLVNAETKMTIYSQCDGWWKDKQYRTSTLEHSGCAIFSLSHALQLLGYTGEEIQPDVLAKTYATCLLDGGTMNSALVGRAAKDVGFKTRYELYESKAEIIKRFSQGAVFSFSIVSGHIAMVAELSEDQTKCRVIDSAPSATFERIKGGKIYYRDADGAFIEATAPSDIPDAVYYFANDAYGGMTYWMDLSYIAKRGVRLIQPQ